ncbi:hypothetical protein FP2506_17784 [Fulvimarina pelagi HTCC2506]|uniref:Uncharacterized protein n=1 Tax=Fulvimarina pelagi HTCC2506 TaxID=314231 RepID=Q0FXZ1_9HYPH|nr:hypothetical protein FP2506_17784 [Fulvimarina pelagi HTCC2506]
MVNRENEVTKPEAGGRLIKPHQTGRAAAIEVFQETGLVARSSFSTGYRAVAGHIYLI